MYNLLCLGLFLNKNYFLPQFDSSAGLLWRYVWCPPPAPADGEQFREISPAGGGRGWKKLKINIMSNIKFLKW